MSETLPEPITPAEIVILREGTLADLEDLVDEGLEHVRRATFAYAALALIHARKEYGHNFEDYCYERFGISRSSGWRWVKVGQTILAGAKPQSQRAVTVPKSQKSPGQSVPRRATSDPVDVPSQDITPQATSDDRADWDHPQADPLHDVQAVAEKARQRGVVEPSASASKPEIQAASSLEPPVTQTDYRRLVALVITAGSATLRKSCDPDQLRNAARILTEAVRETVTPPTPLFGNGRCDCKTPTLSKTVSNLCTTCKRMRRVG